MAADTMPVLSGVLHDQRRSMLLWAVAVAAVTAIYVGFYPAIGEAADLQPFIENLPEGLVQALGYEQIATPAGYLRSTIYGLLGPVLLLVFAIGSGARLLAGQEEEGTLELELTAPVSRREVLAGRLLALWLDVVLLVAVVTATTLALVTALDMEVGVVEILAAGIHLLLLVIGFGTIAMAVGAVTGRRVHALAGAAALAVVAFMFDAIGPLVGADWMTAVSPFSWYIEPNPLVEGFHAGHLALLAVLPIAAAAVAFPAFDRRDVMV